jgi:hypothetical protein
VERLAPVPETVRLRGITEPVSFVRLRFGGG